eukprot:scaffold201691_cov14-Tisochrysis_lutea.AAC.1
MRLADVRGRSTVLFPSLSLQRRSKAAKTSRGFGNKVQAAYLPAAREEYPSKPGISRGPQTVYRSFRS